MKYFLKAHIPLTLGLLFRFGLLHVHQSQGGGTFPYQEAGEARTRISEANFGAKSPQSPITEAPPRGASVKRNWYCGTIIS